MTDLVAWWGAIIATIVLIWDIYKHKSTKPVLLVRSRTIVSPEKRLEIEVSNVGSKETTITDVYVQEGGPAIMVGGSLNEREHVPTTGIRYEVATNDRFNLPFFLAPGSVWVGHLNPDRMERIDDLENVVVKVRDERGAKAARSVVSVPSLWHRSERSRDYPDQ